VKIEPPPVVALSAANTTRCTTNQKPVSIDAKVVDPEGGDVTVSWQAAEGTLSAVSKSGATFQPPARGGTYSVVVDATDSDGNVTRGTIEFRVVEECTGKLFVRGDADADGAVNLADAVMLANYVGCGGPSNSTEPPFCLDAADANDDGAVDCTDHIFLINYLFTGGPPPAFPGPMACGGDLTTDQLSCILSAPCE